MKLLSLDQRKEKAVIEPQTTDDLWRLGELLEPGDIVTGRTERKVTLGEDKTVRKPMTLTIRVERCELAGDQLRILGTVTEGTEHVSASSHHTITARGNDILTIAKPWQDWQLAKLREDEPGSVLVCVLDREDALFALLKREPTVLGRIKGNVQKKGIDGGEPYWQDVASEIAAYAKRHAPQHIILASPAFFKEYVHAHLTKDLQAITVSATVSSEGEAALSELVRRPEVKHALAKDRYTKEAAIADEIMAAIREDKAAYGIAAVHEAVDSGAVALLVVTTECIKRMREEGTYERIAMLLRAAAKAKGDVHILETSASKQIDKLGGIAGVRRW